MAGIPRKDLRSFETAVKLINKTEFENDYSTHNQTWMCDKYIISKKTFKMLLSYYDIDVHDVRSRPGYLSIYEKALNRIDKDEFIYDYNHHGLSYMVNKYQETKATINQIVKYYNLPKHSHKKACELSWVDNYGSLEDFVAQKNAKTVQTNIEKYGVEYVTQNAAVRQKSAETKLEKYGTSHYNNIEKRKQTNLKKYGVEHNWSSANCRNKCQQTMIDKYGAKTPLEVPEIKSQIYSTMLERYGTVHALQVPEFQSKFIHTCNIRYGIDFPAQNTSIYSKVNHRTTQFITSDNKYDLDSSWELLVYEYALRNNLSVKRNVPIKVVKNGKIHITYIDFEIDGNLIEVKGPHLLAEAYENEDYLTIQDKLYIYEQYHVLVVTSQADIFVKHTGNQDKLVGVDINLFNKPEFPYREDRPKCFYDVSVNNCPSAYVAFNDELTRWEMILNRARYVGGFIDAKQIVTALNVTRTAKQPSWFSKKRAKYIITKYCTSNIIVDSFAGWGTRADAATELHKQYIGIDMNEKLVVWHKEHNRNIEYGDANTFAYNNECSVFICPPYQDIEVYFEGQDIKTTQCEWLKVCMKNIPNAKEYVMVCKIVDKGFEPYIVETIKNKSHFGTNNEYIIVIPNSEVDNVL